MCLNWWTLETVDCLSLDSMCLTAYLSLFSANPTKVAPNTPNMVAVWQWRTKEFWPSCQTQLKTPSVQSAVQISTLMELNTGASVIDVLIKQTDRRTKRHGPSQSSLSPNSPLAIERNASEQTVLPAMKILWYQPLNAVLFRWRSKRQTVHHVDPRKPSMKGGRPALDYWVLTPTKVQPTKSQHKPPSKYYWAEAQSKTNSFLIFFCLLIMVLCSRDLECHAIKKLGLLLLKVERLKISGFRFIRFLKVYETKLKFSIFLTLLT